MRFLLSPPTMANTQEDIIFADLQEEIMKPAAWEARRNAWILYKT